MPKPEQVAAKQGQVVTVEYSDGAVLSEIVPQNGNRTMVRYDQLPDVVVVQAVEDGGALAAGADQPRHPQLRQVLRHRRGRLTSLAS